MARKKTAQGPMSIESIKHEDKRTNIPTADAHDFVDPAVEEVRKVRYKRDETCDPQLVWREKYPDTAESESPDNDLIVDAPPIYIQEKIDARVLIENLRQTAEQSDNEPEPTLFDDFDGLDELDQVDFYKHEANWSNRMILGDSLQVMSSLAERERLRGQVQMIYIDPPYGIKFGSNWQVSARNRDVKDGRFEDIAREAEQIKAFRDTWELGIHSYLSYLRDRLLVARELLTESGSCFVQIGDENVHLVRSLLDEVFGRDNFVSLITFSTTGGATSDFLAGTADYIIWFAKNKEFTKFRRLFGEKWLGRTGASKYTLEDDDGRPYRLDNLTSQSQGRAKGEGAASWFPVSINGREFRPTMQSRWKTHEIGMERLKLAGRVKQTRNTLSYVRYLDDFPAYALTNTWFDIGGVQSRADPKVYVVQTATKAIERCMLMCTDPGDLVLDPTCGGGSTAYVAEQRGRRWITIDTSRVALTLARQRLMSAKFPWYLLSDSLEGHSKEQALTPERLPRVEFTNNIRHGFVYERVQHITLKSIANNPDIEDGMSSGEINKAIKRHADFELLYDKPYEDKKKVRVAGPFTVESLSPHRPLAFSDGPDRPASENAAIKDTDAPGFERTILDNLAKAGIQNGHREERITFASFENYAGKYIQAVGERSGTGSEDITSRVAVAIGPQYGTVDASFVKKATREAINAEDVDLLCILGFAFDAKATGVTESDDSSLTLNDEGFANVQVKRQFGRIPVLMVRMNADLLMGEELRKNGAGNLFTVFGEPDIEVEDTDDGLVVRLNGVDVYDPTTGAVRSRDTNQISLWMIDTNYDEESFFVRRCYFTGDNDSYRQLKAALKSEIDADAWASLYDTISRPFPKPETGKIAVKVINDYGDEVMKVFEVDER